ncbi:MAG: type II toxin-antitoxin system RelB/DinJ family antitoxin [Sphaerochaetaceae bacterium]|nr:type II toxin-antitoxin system RelB/DinJ family antitoxin [Bacilli bacterium]MCF0238283.1 type II toxin-antitoxin system RelB/DinJ family antitoxin [Sphaerochaetaceae bacterium]
MSSSTLVQVRLDSETKEKATSLYEKFGLDLPTAIRMFIKKSLMVNGLPFDVRDNDSFLNAFENARKIIQENNVPELSLEEINDEIANVRKGL